MGYEFTETLWLTEDKEEVVKDGDPRARFLVGVPGQTIPDAEAERLGLSKRPAQAKADDVDATPTPPAAKAVQPEHAENKAIRMGGDGPKGKAR